MNNWELIDRAVGKAERMLLYGPPGVGKTHAACLASRRRGQRLFNIYLTDETPSAELRGHYIPKGNEWLWHHGPAMLGWLGAGRLVVNEINNASGDTLDFLLAVLEDPSLAQITLPSGETVRPEPGFQTIATMNGEPADLPEALRSRFVIKQRVAEPHPKAIKKLPADLRNVFTQKLERMSFGENQFLSIRSWLEFDRLRKNGFSEQEAAQLVFEANGQSISEALLLQRKGRVYQPPVPKGADQR